MTVRAEPCRSTKIRPHFDKALLSEVEGLNAKRIMDNLCEINKQG